MRAGLLGLLFALTAAAAPPRAIDERLLREADRLEAALRTIDAASLPKEIAPLADADRKLIADARAAASEPIRLRRLRDAYVGVETLQFVAEHGAAAADLEKVRALAGSRQARFGKPLPAVHGTALEAALQQIAANRADKLFRASVPYGKAASPFSGLYYLAEAEANRSFADFVAALPAASSEPRPNANAVVAALARLDQAALAAFETDPAGRSAIGLSARLKEARELVDRGGLEGAALLTLEAQLDISRRGPQKGALTAPAHNDSIAALWQDMRSADPQSAAFIERDVLPLYASLYLPATAVKKVPASVTVTLVRWPYT